MKKYCFYLVFLICCFNYSKTVAQIYSKDTCLVTSYLHIFPEHSLNSYPKSLVGFVLKHVDSAGNTDWESEKITTFDSTGSDSGVFIKVDLPLRCLKGPPTFWCTSLTVSAKNNDTIRYSYGGVKLSDIRLFLKSRPEGAETFLIPNRIWQNKIEGTNWEKNNSIIENFRVNTSITNTFANVDQTVFVVLFKLKDKFKKIVHFTKPANVEHEQTVWVEF